MNDAYLTEDEKKQILTAIDFGEWKHSWHLPKDRNGYIDWHNEKTIDDCLKALESDRRYAIKRAAICDLLSERLTKVQACRAKEAEESL